MVKQSLSEAGRFSSAPVMVGGSRASSLSDGFGMQLLGIEYYLEGNLQVSVFLNDNQLGKSRRRQGHPFPLSKVIDQLGP